MIFHSVSFVIEKDDLILDFVAHAHDFVAQRYALLHLRNIIKRRLT